MAVDGGGQRLGQQLEDVLVLLAREALARTHVIGSDEHGRLFAQVHHVACQQDRLEGAAVQAQAVRNESVTNYLTTPVPTCVKNEAVIYFPMNSSKKSNFSFSL